MEITHDLSRNVFEAVVDGYTASVSYAVVDGVFDVEHTVVPREIGGRGVAAALVKAAYDYAREQGLKPRATCAYAVAWLKRNPSYQVPPDSGE